ncbi:glycosyltransferase family 39 protein [Desulfopila sp. IMCC35008]|uniref:ArnT family glycosyltransferase n=1 Tax=Desulfopila sp. IMCC35008 TaxID=2653858 RepID=UPI0013D6FC75|nr:glycosyltransferase family 39 protein [Desulfopila sp. IMCC35008]
MIGDEVTHYYMLVKQAEDLSKPNFFAEIPIATGEVEVRRYPHSFLWHYIGAVIFYLTGGSFVAIQLYQTFFLVQFLTVAYLLARDRYGVESRSALAYVLVLASLPLTLIFSVTFYQDVPMTAQILTAFYLLRKGRWFWASLFLSLAIGFKVTAALFYPPFFLLLFFWQLKERGRVRSIAVTICALFIVLGVTWKIGRAIVTYGESVFYPQYQLERVIKKTKEFFESKAPVVSKKSGISEVNTDLSARPQQKTQIKESKPPIIANHPGDLRIKINYLVYGGLVLWITVAAGVLSKLISFIGLQSNYYKKSSFWLYLVGGTYTIMAAWYIRTAPDARFFLPGVPFLILPLLEKAVRLPKTKIFISGLAVLACLQGGYVLQKAYKLRALTSGMKEGIAFLEKHPPSGHIFMYPEGNYRFFPAQHEWYLGYRLRDFWRADNTARINLLNKYDISTVVVKKHLIAVVDEKITNLGVYPSRFVNDIKSDHRFSNVFENQELMIFELTGIGLK